LVKAVTADPEEQERLLSRCLKIVSETGLDRPSPAIARQLHDLVLPFMPEPEEDPFLQAKEIFNRLALQAFPEARARVKASRDPFREALKLAAAGNIIDLGLNVSIGPEELFASLEAAAEQEIIGDIDGLRAAVEEARSILYLLDNAGEIVFDKLVLELLPRERVTAVVRGFPVLNDATMEDAVAAGVTDLVEVIDNGSGVPGIILEDCNHDFRRLFREADLVIAKGQGNFETLEEGDRDAFCLLKVKCDVVAARLGRRIGDLVLHHYRPAAV